MKYLKDSGFVIKRVNVGECDRFVTLYSRDNGKIELLAKGVRKISSRRSSHIELLNHIRFQAVKGRKNFILTDTELLQTYDESKKNIDEVGRLFLICELVEKLCPLLQNNSDIYALIHHSLLNKEEKPPEEISFQFEVELLSLLGFWDPSRNFRDEADVKQFIEGILERKLKTNLYFGTTNS